MESPDQTPFDMARDRIAATYVTPLAERPGSTARGLHHVALISSDVERTIRFYQGVLGFPLTEVMENRDYAGSTHFFFDIGNHNLLELGFERLAGEKPAAAPTRRRAGKAKA